MVKVKTFISTGYDLEASMEGLERKINEWIEETKAEVKVTEHEVSILNDKPTVTAIIQYVESDI